MGEGEGTGYTRNLKSNETVVLEVTCVQFQPGSGSLEEGNLPLFNSLNLAVLHSSVMTKLNDNFNEDNKNVGK